MHKSRVRLLSGILLVLASAGGLRSETEDGTLLLEFDDEAGIVLDRDGHGTGFDERLPGTNEADEDPLLDLDIENGHLKLTSSLTDFNGGMGLDRLSAPGIKLSSLGYTGKEDFTLRAVFRPLKELGTVDQVGIYVGVDAKNLTRAGVIQFDSPERLAVHTTNGVDNNGKFFDQGLTISDGLEVIIRRVDGDWQYLVDGTEWQPNSVNAGTGEAVDPNGKSGAPNLDEADDLYVGVFALTVFNSDAKTAEVDTFEVTVEPTRETAAEVDP